jgi:glycine/D-amino acid oxidase-like deaminating enzyme
MPQDGFPVVGQIDDIRGLYLAVLHSGVTLAPAIGRLVADEALTGQRDNRLARYGPARLVDDCVRDKNQAFCTASSFDIG